MAQYRMIVQKLEENPKYAEELEKWTDRNRYGGPCVGEPRRFFEGQMLEVVLTEDEYKAVKKSVLEVKL